jgi:hypothetical protein
VLEGLQKRHVYASTANILADVRSGANLMGDAFSTASAPSLVWISPMWITYTTGGR